MDFRRSREVNIQRESGKYIFRYRSWRDSRCGVAGKKIGDAWAENFHGDRREVRLGNAIAHAAGAFHGLKRGNEGAARRQHGKSFEIYAGDYAERAERANHYFMDVVTGDVFHHAATAFCCDSFAR